MPISYEDPSESFRRITLTGRLDTAGADEIATRFAALSATANRRVVVDLTSVSFLASIGIRALISNAKALQQRGGRMVLLVGNNPVVTSTLEAAGVDTLIPLFADPAEADRSALA